MADRSEIIYNYAKYAAEPLKSSILGLENWFSTDIDDLYEKYLKDYLENKLIFESSDVDKIKEICDQLANKVSTNTFTILKGAFNALLTKNQSISHELFQEINNKIDKYKPNNRLDLGLIPVLRALEEEVYK